MDCHLTLFQRQNDDNRVVVTQSGSVLENGLWVPGSFNMNRFRAITKTVTLPDGTRAKITIDDSRTVKQIETDDRLDAVVRPKTVAYRLRQIAG